MRALIIGDAHLADRPPSIRTESYASDVLAKLEWAVRHAAEVKADAVIQAGDLFHVKAPSRTSHELVQRAHEVLTAPGIPVLVVPGNHDMQHDRLESLDRQPLGALCRMRGVEVLVGPHRDLPVFGIPWLSDWGTELNPWLMKYGDWADRYMPVDEQDFPLLVTHAPIFPSGHQPPYDFIDAQDWAELMRVGACLYGHIHDPHGYYLPDKSIPVVMGNAGALSRGSLHEATLRRKPAVTMFDSRAPYADVFTRVEVPHRPIEEVFALAAREREGKEMVRMTEFLDGLEEEGIEVTSVEAVVAHLATLDISVGTRKAAEELVTWAATR